ncbi:putative phosphatidylinositol-4-phosphate 5-kinase [Trypanosoma grayi]|uniref:putative phosphatidylinositol-4-phosphate 5-kinase n=1 Tax=Trypanosoma grayi TaxID=71804 RepID=UPI0004F404F3|nr:putative phosphatidylinositol-4-phosphate 5-kinase [Trypanosoma grayi]KEG13109.1 putative phosphatidylinositol-4-phosphate 5-kinase [Trypanosoma grayi]
MRQGSGTIFYPSGTLYEGKWHNNRREGIGCLSSPKGYQYSGEWRDDVPHGEGYEVFACRVAIDARYENGVPEGMGAMLYNPKLNAYRYEGDWHNGRRHGKGVIFYANGDTFACIFNHGKRHGRGVTTQAVNGRVIQYETEWRDDKLISTPKLISKALHTSKPVSFIPYRTKGYLTATDITKWAVKDEALDLTYDHFMQLKLGFESLDVVGCGFLPLNELHAVWPESNMDMLQKLEADGKDSVQLLDIFAGWYPNMSGHDIARFMQEFISPTELLRLRGCLNGVEDADGIGYYHVVGDTSPLSKDGDQRPPLHLRELEVNQHRIGGEKFTAANYAAACQLHDPPHFLDVLEVWYPNILRVTLEQYEIEEIGTDIIDAIRVDFNRYTHESDSRGAYLLIDEFVQAEARYRERLLAAHHSVPKSTTAVQLISPTLSTPRQLPVGLPIENAVEADMRRGFLKGTVMWVLGNRIRISIPLLVEIENFYVSRAGQIRLDELLRFCFPNVACLRTQEALLGQFSQTPCLCSLCKTVLEM